jgi:hypothetical protein
MKLTMVIDARRCGKTLRMQTLAAAHAALQRQEAAQHESVEAWATRLANDLAQHRD